MVLRTIRMGRLTCLLCDAFVRLRRDKVEGNMQIGADTQRGIEFDAITQQDPVKIRL